MFINFLYSGVFTSKWGSFDIISHTLNSYATVIVDKILCEFSVMFLVSVIFLVKGVDVL